MGKGSEPLLAVKQQKLSFPACGEFHTFNGTRLEPDLRVPRLQQHDGTEGMTVQHGLKELPDPLVLPLVASLEVGQLDVTRAGPFKILTQFVHWR